MLIKKSFFNRIMSIIQKSNNDNFESLKAEVLEVLKKQAKKENAEVNKALCEMESKTSYITKSVKGDIIQKSGYPVGTVREWKGKKYIKIAPKMWKRKYDKTDKGASISIGKLIKQVENCKDVESLMNLVLANKQRFTDENGNHLPIVDKLRAAVDKKNDSFDSETKIKTPKKKTPKTEDKKEWTYENVADDYLKGNEDKVPKGELAHIETSKRLMLGRYEKFKKQFGEEKANLYLETQLKKNGLKTPDGVAAQSILNEKQKESEAEKHANRSEGMKGNQNAKKDGVSEEPTKENIKKQQEDELKQEQIMQRKVYKPLREKLDEFSKKIGFNLSTFAEYGQEYDELKKDGLKFIFKKKELIKYAGNDKKTLERLKNILKKNNIKFSEANPTGKYEEVEIKIPLNELGLELPPIPSELQQKESTTENKTLSDVRKKYETSKSVQGNKKTVTLPNGEKIKCHYKLVEADAPTASHDEKTFAQSKGFPTNKDGSTINDRDYSQDRDAQESVISIAQKYGSQALENPPIVTKDGIVLSGNNRTMSSKLAAKNGTDKAYLDDLEEQIDEFGIDEDELKGFKHPRIILEIDEEHKGDYTTQEMAKYNETGMKTQNTTEKAVKISKTLNQESIADISSSLEGFETLGELYNDPSGVSDFISKLVANGVLNNQNKMDYVNNDNTLSDAGKEFIETVLCGTILNESNIRQMNTAGGKQIRKKLIRALMPLAQNKGNGNEYSISTELNEAVNIALQMSKNPKEYPTIDSYLQSQDMFNDKKTDDITAKFAEYVHGLGEKAFASKMQSLQAGLRESASGEQDIFFGGCESKDDVMKRIFEIKKSVQNAISSLCRMIF